ncbi:MAG: hypothetical protein ACI85O_003194 [Saprospiraceae bacterium]|jgi:hypothetical protein
MITRNKYSILYRIINSQILTVTLIDALVDTLSFKFRIFADMIRYFIIFLPFLCLFSACEKEVDIDVAPISSKLVIISNFSGSNEGHALSGADFFSRDSVMRVTVSRIEPALSASGDTLINVPDAVVELYSGSQFLERLAYHPLTEEEKALGLQPYYEAESFRLSAGETYKLEVSAPNFTPITAEAYIPAIVSETRASISISESTTSNGFRDVDFTLNLEIDDLPGIKNYYHLNLYQVVNLLRINTDGDTSRTGVLIGPLAFNLQNNNQEVLPYINNRGVLIRDDNFDGETGNFTFEGEFLYNPQSEDLGDFIVELRNTSRDYYLYHSSLARQVRVQSGFDAISGPVVLHNNIENGFGIFAGYTPAYTTIDLSD